MVVVVVEVVLVLVVVGVVVDGGIVVVVVVDGAAVVVTAGLELELGVDEPADDAALAHPARISAETAAAERR